MPAGRFLRLEGGGHVGNPSSRARLRRANRRGSRSDTKPHRDSASLLL